MNLFYRPRPKHRPVDEPIIRRFRPADLIGLIRVWERACGDRESPGRNLSSIYLAGAETWVLESIETPSSVGVGSGFFPGVECNKQLIGFVTLLVDEIQAIYILPEYQGQGLGRRLLDRVSGGRDKLEVWMPEQADSSRYFLRQGFSPASGEQWLQRLN